MPFIFPQRNTHGFDCSVFFNGLFATQPNNCTIFPMYLPLSLCFLFWSSAYWQRHSLKRRKMANQILGIWTLFISSFFFSQGLLLYKFPWNQTCAHLPPSPWAEPHLCALNAVIASHSSDAIYHKVKITEESPAEVFCVSGFFLLPYLKERQGQWSAILTLLVKYAYRDFLFFVWK